MAESQSPPPPPLPPSSDYWCYHCDKRVLVHTLPDQSDVLCNDCQFGFVESIPPAAAAVVVSSSPADPTSDETTLGRQFLQVLRLLAQVARDDDVTPPPPPPPAPADPAPSDENDFLRIEINGWDNDNEDDEDGDEWVEEDEEEEEREESEDEEEEETRSVEIEGQSDDDRQSENDRRQRRHDILRLRLQDFATRTRSESRSQILDWAEILMGLEDNSIEFRFEPPLESDRYIGNPGDYVNAAEYETLLQNLAEADGRRGAPRASESAVEKLKIVEIMSQEESYVCAICKDGVNVGEFVKEMPCGHGYHGDCIVPWLATRNSCPVCRFELPTDDLEYEEERKKKDGQTGGSLGTSVAGGVGSSSASSGLS